MRKLRLLDRTVSVRMCNDLWMDKIDGTFLGTRADGGRGVSSVRNRRIRGESLVREREREKDTQFDTETFLSVIANTTSKQV